MTNFQGPDEPTTVEDEQREDKKDPGIPEGFTSKEDFLKYAMDLYANDLDADNDNRRQAIEDAKFMAGDQWEDHVLQQRVADTKPTLTLNRLPAFIGQLVGNRKLNQTDIKIVPDDGSDKQVARIREGLIRNIQKNSNAEFAYDKAYENQVVSGMGNFKVELVYASDDVFEQDIRICPIPNALSVVWDRMSVEPTGGDARHAFIVDSLTSQEFKEQYPNANGATMGADDVREYLTGFAIEDSNWYDNDTFRLLEFWRMRTRRRTVALLESDVEEGGEQQIEDVTDMDFEDFADRLVQNDKGVPMIREVDRPFAEMYLMTATDILEGPYELPIKRVPVFKATGWELNIGEKRKRFGLVRFMKDPQRLHNYWRSVIAEKLMQTPKGTWMAADTAVEGREEAWRQSHTSNDPLLVWNSESGLPPQRIQPAQIEGALIQEAGMASQDLYDISNLHQASLGQQSNEVSGKAILARQRVGETGTAVYETNLQLAIEACGDVINQLIPTVYDTARVIKIMGEDGKDISPVLINDTTNPDSVDITLGKYSVSSVTGPSYVTKRVEAADSMLNMVNAAPQTMAVVLDKIIEAQDWPGASEIAARLRTQLPPGVILPNEMTPEEQAAQQAAQQAQQAQQAREDAVLEAELMEKQGRAQQSFAYAQQAVAQAAKAYNDMNVDVAKLISQTEDARSKRFLEAVKQFQELSTPQ